MRITQASVILSSPGRNFATLRIETDAGIYGLGDATVNGREKAVVSYLEDYLLPCLIGRDPFDTEDIWHYGYQGAYWRRGPIGMAALGAIDVALWDIKGKALGVPVYQLLGGSSREKMLVYTHANGITPEETLQKVEEKRKAGYRAIRVQSGIPGMDKIYGVSKGKGSYEPAVRGEKPVEESWNSEKYLSFIPGLFREVREQFGEDLLLLHDAHHRLTPIEAARLGKELEPYHLFWLEDTTPAEWQANFRLIRQHTTTPLAVGEVFNSAYDVMALITGQLIDYVRMTVSHTGGLTHMMKIAALAALYQIKTGCHGPSDISPVALAACLHFGKAINNFGIQEYMGYDPLTEAVFPHEYFFDDGYLHLTAAPGLGVDFDEALARQHPYQRAYLPVNRKEDGTLFHW